MPIVKASESEHAVFDVIPTSITEIDLVTGIGGIPTKKITEIWGAWSIGKSTVAMYLVASAQSQDRPVLWADVERSWTNEYAKVLGVDPETLDLAHEDCAEDYLDDIEKWAHEKKNGLIILDSVGQLTPREEMEKGAEGRVIGAQARLMAAFVRRMKIHINVNNHALVVLNHEYNPINFGGPAMAFPQSKPSGGTKLEYAKDLSIHLKEVYPKVDDKVQRIVRKDGTKGGAFIRATIYKSKVAPSRAKEGVFALTYGMGTKPDWNLLETALEAGVVTKTGNTYSFAENKLAVGLKATRTFIEENPDIKEEIKSALKNKT